MVGTPLLPSGASKAELLQPPPELRLRHAVPDDLSVSPEQNRNLEPVALLQLGILADVPLDEPGGLDQHPFRHRPHLMAEVAVRFPEQGEGVRGHHRPQEAWPPGWARGRRHRVRSPAPAMMRRIVS
jgi:hypothetical protein